MKRKALYLCITMVLLTISGCGKSTQPAETIPVIAEPETTVESEMESTEELQTESDTETETEIESTTSEETETQSESNEISEAEETEFERPNVTPLDQDMYVTAPNGCNVRDLPGTENTNVIKTLGFAEKVHATGVTQSPDGKDWYRIELNDEGEVYISASLLSDTKPEPPKTSTTTTPNSTETTFNTNAPEDNSPAATGNISNEPHEPDRVVTNPDGSTTTIGWGSSLDDNPYGW